MERPTVRLSILICHLNGRSESLARLLGSIQRQVVSALDKKIEVLVEGDDGDMSVGKKRNMLLEKATGEYSAFVDDDDTIAEDYVQSIYDATKTGPDCVGIDGIMKIQGQALPFRHSIEYQGWYTGVDAYYRTPNHLNPIKTAIARKIGFPEIDNGEDRLFSESVRRLLNTEVYIDHPIYFYEKDNNARTID